MACIDCTRLEILEAVYAAMLRDLITYYDPTFPQTREEIYAAGGSVFRGLGEGVWIQAEAGAWCLINVAHNPAFDCSAPSVPGGGGAAGSRRELLTAICTLAQALDAGYSCIWDDLLASAGCMVGAPPQFNRGNILYMLLVYEAHLTGNHPTLKTLGDLLATGCCLVAKGSPFWPTAVLADTLAEDPPTLGTNVALDCVGGEITSIVSDTFTLYTDGEAPGNEGYGFIEGWQKFEQASTIVAYDDDVTATAGQAIDGYDPTDAEGIGTLQGYDA